MLAVKGHEMQSIDLTATTKFGIPGIVLMENAARSFVDEVLKDPEIWRFTTIIFCGTGNNGGDGFAIARHLHGKKIKVQVVIVGEVEKIKGDAFTNYHILTNLQVPILQIKTEMDLDLVLSKMDSNTIIIDALLGTGCQKNIDGLFAKTILALNLLGVKIFSVDMPSGVHPDHGEIMGVAIKAFKTITFCLPKIGLFLYPGALMTGDVVVVNIGIPEEVWSSQEFKYEIIEDSFKKLIPARNVVSHKGTYGKVLIIAGSSNMMGAAQLAARAAYKTGCGLVKVFTEKGHEASLFQTVPEAIIETYTKECSTFEEELIKLEKSLAWADAVLIGPGMSDDDFTYRLLEKTLQNQELKVIIDADGLNALSKNLLLLTDRKEKVIITPHIGEMSRLTGYSTEDILKHTVEFSMAFSQKYQVITVLKGARTIVVDDDLVFINIFGNNGMATAGSGDTLSGMMVSLLAQNQKNLQSATVGVYLHSKAGDFASERLGQHSLMASDIIDSISHVMR